MKFHLKYRLSEIQPLLDELNKDDTCLCAILLKASQFHHTAAAGHKSKGPPKLRIPQRRKNNRQSLPVVPRQPERQGQAFYKNKESKTRKL